MLGLSVLLLSSSAQAHMMSLGTKPVLLMLGEAPISTLTTSHLRREGWRYQGDALHGTKPVVKMLSR